MSPVFVCKGFELLGRFGMACLDYFGIVWTLEEDAATVEEDKLAVAFIGPALLVVAFFVFNLRLAVGICMEF